MDCYYSESKEFEMMKEWDMQLPPPMLSYPKIQSSASMFGMFYGASNINVQIIQNAPSPVNDKVNNNKPRKVIIDDSDTE